MTEEREAEAPRYERGTDVRVLICSERRALAGGLAQLLRGAGLEPSHTTPARLEEAVHAVAASVLLLHTEEPWDARCHADVARRVRPDIQVLLLTMEPDDQSEMVGSEIGATGALTYHAAPEQFVDAVRGAHEGKSPAAGSRPARRTKAQASPLDQLTRREVEVLRTIMLGGRNAAIARQLGISPNTLQTHIQNIFLKLGVSSRFEAAAVARQAGLRPISDPDLAGGVG